MAEKESKGALYLIPVPLGENALHTIPEYVIQQIHQLRFFIAERAKTARHFLKSTNPPFSLQEIEVFELDKHQPSFGLSDFFAPALSGNHIGLMSEAGCPGVADPGALVVEQAHRMGIEVKPLVGPSSILLVLMGSGFNGQQFSFHGYLPSKGGELSKSLKYLESQVLRNNATQIFIETPYRNAAIIDQVLKNIHPDLGFCIAADLTLPSQFISTKTIQQWKQTTIPDLNKRPAVFAIGQISK